MCSWRLNEQKGKIYTSQLEEKSNIAVSPDAGQDLRSGDQRNAICVHPAAASTTLGRAHMNRPRKLTLRMASYTAVILSLTIAGHAVAQDLYTEPTIGLRLGAGEHYQRAELAWESPSLWAYRFDGGSRLDLVGELGAAWWHAEGSRDPRSIWQFSVIPFLRYTWSDRYFIEAGIGPTVFTGSSFSDKNLSTAFQFGDHLGIGILLNEDSRLSLRISHFSNAGIKHPNPGLNIVQMNYSLRY